MNPTRILFVCHGNTCRSPMAEALARRMAEDAGRTDLSFASAGIVPRSSGAAADPRAVACIGRRGIDLTAHAVRALDADAAAREFDLLLALDDAVLAAIMDRVPAAARANVRALMSFAPNSGISEVPDPYHGTPADYDRALGLIERAVAGLLADPILKPFGRSTAAP